MPTTRGGADSIRYASSSARARTASMEVLDVDDDDPKVKRDGWFAYVMPTQTGVEMVGSGRYGYWEERPKVTYEPGTGCYRVEGDTEEPILLVPVANVITVYIAQAKHLEAMPMPQLQAPEERS